MQHLLRSPWTCRLVAAFLVCVIVSPAFAQRGRAQELIDEAEALDVRHQGYEDGPYLLEEGGYALTYAVAAGLTLACVAVMFKNAKRTHLD
ncbi:MAG: hypothetical protein AAGD32_18090 [Planctomycetota bacterium]